MTRLLLLACFVLACQQRSAVQNPPPPPSPPPPPGGVDTIPIAGHALYVPAGFTVNLFAQQIPGPRNLALGLTAPFTSPCRARDRSLGWSTGTGTASPSRWSRCWQDSTSRSGSRSAATLCTSRNSTP